MATLASSVRKGQDGWFVSINTRPDRLEGGTEGGVCPVPAATLCVERAEAFVENDGLPTG